MYGRKVIPVKKAEVIKKLKLVQKKKKNSSWYSLKRARKPWALVGTLFL
jgi:hypothetical protein